MPERVSTLEALNVGDTLRFGTAAVLLPCLYVAVSVVSFARLRTGLLGVFGRLAVPGSPGPKRIVWAVTTTDRYLPGERKCLVRSLTSEVLLHLYGHCPQHRIGVDRAGDTGVEAHSWLEYDGEVLIGDVPDLDRYEPLPSLESANLT